MHVILCVCVFFHFVLIIRELMQVYVSQGMIDKNIKTGTEIVELER